MPSAWKSYGCPESTKQWRYLDDGRIEVSGVGAPESAWPSGVEQWRSLIEAAASKYGLPPAWVAAAMAQETGGRNVCLSVTNRVCSPPCQCDPGEGAGLMAMTPGTATGLAGRKVTSQQLMDDPALAVDLGAKYIRVNLDANGGDYMRAALAYNAGSVRCGRGTTFIPAAYKGVWPKESCPPTGWGVVMGCIYSDKLYGSRCAPTTSGAPKPYVCSTDYPSRAVEVQNAARRHFEGRAFPPPPPPVAVASTSLGGNIFAAGAGVVIGYLAMALLA